MGSLCSSLREREEQEVVSAGLANQLINMMLMVARSNSCIRRTIQMCEGPEIPDSQMKMMMMMMMFPVVFLL